jgi:SPP1 gp7 family putative phage head morphogenesis protein
MSKAKPKKRLVEMNFQKEAEPFFREYRALNRERFKEMKAEIIGNMKASRGSYRKYAAQGIAKKFDVDQWLFSRKKWYGTFSKDNKTMTGATMVDAGGLANEALGIAGSFELVDKWALSWLESNAKNAGWSITDSIYDELKADLMTGIADGLSIDDIRDSILDRAFEDMDAARAELIARTETLKASNMGSVDAMRESGVVISKQWLTTEDDRTCDWCASMDGEAVGVEETFFDKGDVMSIGDGDNAQEMGLDYEDIECPPLHPDCRCTIVAIVEGEGGDEANALRNMHLKARGEGKWN